MKRVLSVLAVLLAALILAGCSAISSGTITDKSHREAWTQIVTTTQCNTINKVTTCHPYIYTVYHPEEWEFDLKKGKETGWVYVSSGTYDHYKIGDYFSDGGKND